MYANRSKSAAEMTRSRLRILGRSYVPGRSCLGKPREARHHPDGGSQIGGA